MGTPKQRESYADLVARELKEKETTKRNGITVTQPQVKKTVPVEQIIPAQNIVPAPIDSDIAEKEWINSFKLLRSAISAVMQTENRFAALHLNIALTPEEIEQVNGIQASLKDFTFNLMLREHNEFGGMFVD